MKTGDAAKRELYFAASFFQFLMKQRSGNMAGYAGNAGFSVAIFRIFCYNEGRKYRTERSFYYVKTNHYNKPDVWK